MTHGLTLALALMALVGAGYSRNCRAAGEAPFTGALPPGSVTIPNKDGHFVTCKPPKHYTGGNFKELCAQFLRVNRLARIGMPDPKNPISSWIGPSDYPRELWGTGKQGVSLIAVEIGPSGEVTGCRTVASSGTPELDEAACNAVRTKGRFLPRLGADGKPGSSTYEFPVNWIATDDLTFRAASKPLEPLSAWNVSYEDSQCTASRDYGSAEKPLTLTLVPSVTGSVMRVLFVRQGRTVVTQEPVELRLGSRKPIRAWAFVYEAPEKKHRVWMVNLPMQELRGATAIDTVGLGTSTFSATVPAGDLRGVLGELDKCLDDLREFWNARNISPITATLNQDNKQIGLLSSDDYPSIALNHGLSGTVGMTILIDETGKVADCTVDDTSGVAILDVTSCYIYEKRAKFTPARDSHGKPVRSAVSTHVKWQIRN